MPEYNATEWTATVNKVAIPWTALDNTYEQFHVAATYKITAPLEKVNVAAALADKSPEVTIQYKGEEVFVGVLDDSNVTASPDKPDGEITFTGRDLSAKFSNEKIEHALPLNTTASNLVKQYCTQHGLTDHSGITATGDNVGDFLSKNFQRITRGLNQHDVIFDLAELSGFVFRVHNRKPYFGPLPDAKTVLRYKYHENLNNYHWRKSHRNEDVKVRVLSWNKKTKKKTAFEGGSGSIVITAIRDGFNSLQCKALGDKILKESEQNLFLMELSDLPAMMEDLPFINDILFGFDISGIHPLIDRLFYPTLIHIARTQDEAIMNCSLYNRVKALS